MLSHLLNHLDSFLQGEVTVLPVGPLHQVPPDVGLVPLAQVGFEGGVVDLLVNPKRGRNRRVDPGNVHS